VTFHYLQLNDGFNKSRTATYRRDLTVGDGDLVVWKKNTPQIPESVGRYVRGQRQHQSCLTQSSTDDRVQVYSDDDRCSSNKCLLQSKCFASM
jgi:hypothetical protein